MTPSGWQHLPKSVRREILTRTGPIVEVQPVNAGLNHQLAAILHTTDSAVFIKGMPESDRRCRRQRIEAAVNTVVQDAAPRLLWHLIDVDGWDILAFEALTNARHANLTPATTDLPTIARTLTALGNLTTPPEQISAHIQDRWHAYAQPSTLHLLGGNHLLHTDLRPDNILIHNDHAKIVDWAWPARGAPWIDPATIALWLIAEGQSPTTAETWLHTLPTGTPPDAGLHAYLRIQTALWTEIATHDPKPWKQRLATAAHQWSTSRKTS